MKLSDLTKKRRDHVKSCQENGDRSHEIIADMYADPSHFVYELLQNADDAIAKKVEFNLESQYLTFTHDGDPFKIEDIDSITTIGQSTKKDDINLIGKFGAGFKSVFSITESPSIYSGKYHFRIIDYIVPEEIEDLKDIEDGRTRIVLPFKADYSSEKIDALAERLQNLEMESLLFLQHIKDIHWSAKSCCGYYSSKENYGNKFTLISSKNDDETSIEYFLHRKKVKVDNAKLSVAVAYKLENSKVVSVFGADSGLFVFFPTKELVGLKFLVHAHYKTTPSREIIPFDDPQNKVITVELSNLVAESVLRLKNYNLLSVDALSLLPIDAENRQHPLYLAIYEKVKSVFASQSLLPTVGGGYAKSGDVVLARENVLPELLKEDSKRLFDKNGWVSADITPGRKETRVLYEYLNKELDIQEISMENFCSNIDEGFLKAKQDEWLVKFYACVTNNKALYRNVPPRAKGVLRKRPIIRLEDNSHVCPEDGEGELQVYLPREAEESRFKTVKRALAEDRKALEFLKSLGLKEPDIVSEIKEFIAPKYKGEEIQVSEDEYIEDFNMVLSKWESANEYRRKEILDILKKIHFVRCVTANEESKYQMPHEVYFPTTELSSWFRGNHDSDIYFLRFPLDLPRNGAELMEALGVRKNPKRFYTRKIDIHRHSWHERSVNGFNPGFDIHGLKHALENITFERSLFLWSLLLKNTNMLKGRTETTTNENRLYTKGEERDSKAMVCLIQNRWLYDDDGKLIESAISDISLDELSKQYEKDDANIENLIKALGFKLDETREFEERNPGKKVISQEEYKEFEEYRSRKEQNDNAVNNWTPDCPPDAARPVEDDTASGEPNESDTPDGDDSEPGSGAREDSLRQETKGEDRIDAKSIGEWGEAVARRYLNDKYSHESEEVIWLNENGVGEGCDFVVKKNGQDIAYYEVKSKTGKSPQLFAVTRAQWDMAKQKRGMYKILLVSEAGSKEPKIRTISDPVDLWKRGELEANPVSIRL